VEVTGDFDVTGPGPCVVVRGAGAQLNGQEHTIRTQGLGGVAVRIEGAGASVRNLQTHAVSVGVEVAGAQDVTLYHLRIEAREVGVAVRAAPNFRMHRSRVSARRVGIAFGEPTAGRCPDGQTVQSPGAVVRRSWIEGAAVGIAACDALPVLSQNVITRNDVGLLLGAPARGLTTSGPAGEAASAPFDACLCAPALDGVRLDTTLLFSSGCGGCQVHEGWLPTLRAAGHDIRARETGAGNAEGQATEYRPQACCR
jgi:hypothetical protein